MSPQAYRNEHEALLYLRDQTMREKAAQLATHHALLEIQSKQQQRWTAGAVLLTLATCVCAPLFVFGALIGVDSKVLHLVTRESFKIPVAVLLIGIAIMWGATALTAYFPRRAPERFQPTARPQTDLDWLQQLETHLDTLYASISKRAVASWMLLYTGVLMVGGLTLHALVGLLFHAKLVDLGFWLVVAVFVAFAPNLLLFARELERARSVRTHPETVDNPRGYFAMTIVYSGCLGGLVTLLFTIFRLTPGPDQGIVWWIAGVAIIITAITTAIVLWVPVFWLFPEYQKECQSLRELTSPRPSTR